MDQRARRRRFIAASGMRAAGARRLLLGVAVLVVATFFGGSAKAAVPMCSSDGRSVEAPPIVLPWRKLTLEAPPPCTQTDNPLLRAMPERHERAPSTPVAPAPLRAMPARATSLQPPAGTLVRVGPEVLPSTTALVRSIERPPRA
jgi:hypothetical protein